MGANVFSRRWKLVVAVIERAGLASAQARARPMRWRFLSTDPGSTVKCINPSLSTATTPWTARVWRLPGDEHYPGADPGWITGLAQRGPAKVPHRLRR